MSQSNDLLAMLVFQMTKGNNESNSVPNIPDTNEAKWPSLPKARSKTTPFQPSSVAVPPHTSKDNQDDAISLASYCPVAQRTPRIP